VGEEGRSSLHANLIALPADKKKDLPVNYFRVETGCKILVTNVNAGNVFSSCSPIMLQ
jgi:hypothetical protein